LNRLTGVDVLRVAAIIAVIIIHAHPFAEHSASMGRFLDVATVLNQAARFAVPFFLILSGYFWAHKVHGEAGVVGPSIAMAKRIAIVFLAWSAIYLLPTNIGDALAHGPAGPVQQGYWNLASTMSRPMDAIFQGTKGHLWFLMGLLCSIFISALLLRFKQNRLLVVLALALYLTGLAGKAYSDTPLGFDSAFNFRNGPFFSLIFFVTGYLLRRTKPSPMWLPAGLLIAGAGFVLQLAETWVLNERWGTSLVQDYVFGTYFFGLGIAMVALSNSRFLDFPRLAAIGPLVLGIYAAHMVFIDLLKPVDRQFSQSGWWAVFHVVAVFALSYALARLMQKFRLTRRLVS
jgi:surface polysaccharide O-acyltransferase-like enzyme